MHSWFTLPLIRLHIAIGFATCNVCCSRIGREHRDLRTRLM